MSGGEGFLSRWSRLKREPVPTPGTEPQVETPAAPQPTLPDGRSLDELLAELPRLEDLVPGQSLAAFMQSWVPDAVRNAALQRMWLLDPAIRDYVSPALDYAYDYNTPGAAPGFGPMETPSEAVREVAEMFDRALGGGARQDPAAAPDQAPVAAAPAAPAGPASTAPAGAAGGGGAPQHGGRRDADVATHNSLNESKELRPATRRHGSALPG